MRNCISSSVTSAGTSNPLLALRTFFSHIARSRVTLGLSESNEICVSNTAADLRYVALKGGKMTNQNTCISSVTTSSTFFLLCWGCSGSVSIRESVSQPRVGIELRSNVFEVLSNVSSSISLAHTKSLCVINIYKSKHLMHP